MNFETFAALWHQETFLAGAFNDIESFDSYLDSPECGVGDPTFDYFSREILDVELPTKLPDFEEIAMF